MPVFFLSLFLSLSSCQTCALLGCENISICFSPSSHVVEPEAQQPKKHHHLPISHLISQYVQVWMWDSVFSLSRTHTRAHARTLAHTQSRYWYVLKETVIFFPFHTRFYTHSFYAPFLDFAFYFYWQRSCVWMPAKPCACASAPPSCRSRPSPFYACASSSSSRSSPALHISPGENRPV